MVKLGFIGFGEAAFNIASGLRGEGLTGIIAYDKHWKDSPAAELIGSARPRRRSSWSPRSRR